MTRERIRQLEFLAIKALKTNLVARRLLELTFETNIDAIKADIISANGGDLIEELIAVIPRLRGEHYFLIEILFGTIERFFEDLSRRKLVVRTSLGWWLGEELGPEFFSKYRLIHDLLQTEQRPLLVHFIAERTGIENEAQIERLLRAHKIQILNGVVFEKRPTIPQRRCLLTVAVAGLYEKTFWNQAELYRTVKTIDAIGAASYRLLIRDLTAIPGFIIDSPGPYVAINPIVLKSISNKSSQHSLPALTIEGVDDDDASRADEDNGVHEHQNSTLEDKIESLFAGKRLIKFESLEEAFSRANFGNPVISLGPILVMSDRFFRYAPGYYGLKDMELTVDDISVLCNESDLTKYVVSKHGGGLRSLYPLWGSIANANRSVREESSEVLRKFSRVPHGST